MKMFMSRGPRWLELGMSLIIFVVVVQQIAASESELATTQDCYYNYNHYSEGDRILTNEPCLNCTCHNKMLMCYLKVCPFTKPIGQDCTIEKREDQCCPIITCPEVPVELDSSAAQSSSALASHQPYGCSIDSKFYAEGAQIPGNPKKPCELCYCIRNMTSCVMQECTLHVDGCRPIYNKGVCCPVRYDCAHEYDDSLLLEDQTTTEAPSEGFVIATTSAPSSECQHNGVQYYDGESILTDQPCEHCYCMRGDIVCAVQECVKPLELHGKNCTARTPAAGECCAKDYDCVSDEQVTTILPIESTEKAATLAADALVTTTARASLDAIATERVHEVATESDVAEVPTTEHVDDAENEIHDKDYDHITSKPAKIDNRIEPEATTALPADEERMATELFPPAQPEQPSVEESEGILANLYTTIKSIVDLTTTLGSVSESDIPAKHVSDDEHSMLANVIPGEGDCLENGVSYVNSTSVPSRSNCEISCLCLNSIVQCEKIQCLPIPPNAQNCRRIEDPSQCCARYECDSLDAPVTAVPLAMGVITEQEKSEATTLGAAASEEAQPEAIGTTESEQGTTVQFEAVTTAAPSKLHLPQISSKLEDSLEHGTEAQPEAAIAAEQEHVSESAAATTEAAAAAVTTDAAAAAVTTEAVLGTPTLATRLSSSDVQTEQGPIATEAAVEVVDATTALVIETAADVQVTTSRQGEAQAATTERAAEAATEQEAAEATTTQFEAEKHPEAIELEVTTAETAQKPGEVPTIVDDEKVLPEATTQAKEIESESVTTQRQQEEGIVIEQATSPSEAGEQPIASTEAEQTPESEAATTPQSEQEQLANKLPSLDERVEAPATELQPEQESPAATTQRAELEQELTTTSQEALPSSDERKEGPIQDQSPASDLSTESVELATEANVQPIEAITEGKQPEIELTSTEVPAPAAPIDSERVTESQESAEIATQRQPEVTEQPIESIGSTEAVAADKIPASEVATTQRHSEIENEIPTQSPVEIESGAALTEKPTESPVQEEAIATTAATVEAAVSDEKLATEIPAQESGVQSTEAQSAETAAPSGEDRTTVKSIVRHEEVPEAPELTTEPREQAIVTTERQAEIEQKPTEGQSLTERAEEPKLEATTASRGPQEEIAVTTQQAAIEEVTTQRRVEEEAIVAATERRPPTAVEPVATEKPLPAIEEGVASTESQPSHVTTEDRIPDAGTASGSTERIATPAEGEESSPATTERQDEPSEVQTPEAVTMKRDESITESYNLERITESPVIVKVAAPTQSEESTTLGSEESAGEGEVTEKRVEPITEEKLAAEATTEARIEAAVASEPSATTAAAPEQADATTLASHVADASTEKAVEIVTEARDESELPAVVSEISAAVTTEAQQSDITTQKAVEFSATEARLGEQPTESAAAEASTPARIADEPIAEITESSPEATTLQAEQVTTAAAAAEPEVATEQRIAEQESTTQGASEEIIPSSSEPAAHEPIEIASTEGKQDIATESAAEGESTTSKQIEIESDIPTQAADVVAPEQATTESRAEIATAATTERSSDEIQTERQQIVVEQPIVTESVAPLEIANEQTTLAAQTEKAVAAEEIATEATIVQEESPTTVAAPTRISEQGSTGAAVVVPEATEAAAVEPEATEKAAVEPEATEAAAVEPDATEAAAVEPGAAEGIIGSKFEPIVTTQAPLSDEDEAIEDHQQTTVRAAVSAGGDQVPEVLTDLPLQSTDAPHIPNATNAPSDAQIATEENAVELSTILNRIHEQAVAAGESTTLGALEHDEVPHPIADETTQAPLEQPATTGPAQEEIERATTSAPALPAQEIVVADDNCTGIAEDGATQTTQASEAAAGELASAGPSTEVNKILDLTTILSPHVIEELITESTTAAKEEPESVPSRIGTIENEPAQVTTESAEATSAPAAAAEIESASTSAPAIETTIAPIAEEQPGLPIAHDETQTQRIDSIPSEDETEQPQQQSTQRPFILDTTTIRTLAELITTLQPIHQNITERVAEATTLYNRIDNDEYTSSSTLAAGLDNQTLSSETESPSVPISPPESANNIPLIREPSPADDIIDTTTKLADNFDITTLPSILSSHTTERFISDSITTVKDKQNEITEAAPASALTPSTTTTTTPSTTTATSTTTAAPPAIYQPETERTPAEPEYDTHKPPSSTYAASGIPSSPTSPFDSGYGNVPSQYPDEEYTDEEEPAVFGPGTCRYGGKLYVSAQQIPRDDPCDFCFCFRSDIICLQQSCPPPITGCHEEPIQGFCCPRYECPVSMAIGLNATSTTTTTTLPPHLVHFARNNAKLSKRGCQIQGKSYQIGERVAAASGPCIDCVCGGDGRMKCDPKTCTPEPMLRQMIAVAASRR